MSTCAGCIYEDSSMQDEPCISCEWDIHTRSHYTLRYREEDMSKQVGGNHYKLPIEPIDYILKNHLGYCEGNVVKYVTRHATKNGAEDIRKAIHYLEFILKDQYDELD